MMKNAIKDAYKLDKNKNNYKLTNIYIKILPNEFHQNIHSLIEKEIILSFLISV
jgi:hypothetical protein